MTMDPRYTMWQEFLATWPPERVATMTLEEYTNANKKDAFVYWVEFRLKTLGGVRGATARKFGIYRRGDAEPKDEVTGFKYDDLYGWRTQLGATPQEAFSTVKAKLLELIAAVSSGNLKAIEPLPLGAMYKWKVAFLYQDRDNPVIFPVFKDKALFHAYNKLVPGSKLANTPYHVMYEKLLEHHKSAGDILAIGEAVWDEYKSASAPELESAGAWAIGSDFVPDLVDEDPVDSVGRRAWHFTLPTKVKLEDGAVFAVIKDTRCIALGAVSREDDIASAALVRVDFEPGLQVNPQYDPLKLEGAERAKLFGKPEWRLEELLAEVAERFAEDTTEVMAASLGNAQPTPVQTPELVSANRRYWKIAPGANAMHWDDWREKGYIGVGWAHLGDLTQLDKPAFDQRLVEAMKEHSYGKGGGQAWLFRSIQVGDRVLANHGKHTVLGFGTVVGEYQFDPAAIDGTGYAHRMAVRWDDVKPRAVEKYGWQRTLMKLSQADFEELVGLESAQAPSPDPYAEILDRVLPSRPTNTLLYGPPGTGKTFVLKERAVRSAVGDHDDSSRNDIWLALLEAGRIEFTTFHQAFAYEEFIEGLRPVIDDETSEVRYEVAPGLFKRLAFRAMAEGLEGTRSLSESDDPESFAAKALADGEKFDFRNARQYVLVIDEINRGNVARVFGELITLLEDDKRLTAKEELRVTLPVSGHRFAVPPNLHILGTMNTADRSIALIDVALRRRFQFEEMRPSSRVIRNILGQRGVHGDFIDALSKVFDKLNERLRFVFDREHQIGHAYFLGVKSVADLRDVFAHKVIPLLQEYFFGSWEKVALVLGHPMKAQAPVIRTVDDTSLLVVTKAEETTVLSFDHDDYEDQFAWDVNPGFGFRPPETGWTDQKTLEAVLCIVEPDEAKRKVWAAELVQAMASTGGPG